VINTDDCPLAGALQPSRPDAVRTGHALTRSVLVAGQVGKGRVILSCFFYGREMAVDGVGSRSPKRPLGGWQETYEQESAYRRIGIRLHRD
jgi:hypothetical protein